MNKAGKWLIQGAPNTPHLNWFAASSLTHELEKLQPGVGLNVIVTFFQEQGEIGNWILDEEHLNTVGKYLEEHPDIIDSLFSEWSKRVQEFDAYVATLEKNGITDIITQYQEFGDLYRAEYTAVFLTEYFIVWGDIMINRVLESAPKEYKQDIEQLVLPYKPSFMNQEELSALRIGIQLEAYRELPLKELQEQHPEVYSQIHAHQKKFYWITSGYKHTPEVSIETFYKNILEAVSLLSKDQIKQKITELEQYEQLLEEKKRTIQEQVKLTEEQCAALELLSKIAWHHDMRKRANLVGSYWINQFLYHASKQLAIKHELLQFTVPSELLQLLQGQEIDMNVVLERYENGCVMINDASGGDWLVHGTEFERLKKEILDIKVQDVSDFRGVTASHGKISGVVRVILSPNNATIKDGEILVAPMTRPDFVPLMKKAAGIITDEGGVTSHAAIISRELGIPCIVGTRIATKVLKNGMIVELNGNHGIVKVIESQHE